jgi:hypothetical protein
VERVASLDLATSGLASRYFWTGISLLLDWHLTTSDLASRYCWL